MRAKTKRNVSKGSGPYREEHLQGRKRAERSGRTDQFSSLLSVYPGSTLLTTNDSLRRLLLATDKSTLIHLALNWIYTLQQGHSLDVIHPTLTKRKTSDGHSETQDREGGHEEAQDEVRESKRADSLEELMLIWCANISETEKGKIEVIDRIMDIDWPAGITFSMAAMVTFEGIRANPHSRTWTAMCLDYGDGEETENRLSKTAAAQQGNRPYVTATAQQLREGLSSELKNFCSHAVFLDEPAKQIPIRSRMYESIAPLPSDWTKSFVHLRVVCCASPSEICSRALHILHIPTTPWFLISGRIGYGDGTMMQLAISALAHSLGALRMRTPNRTDSTIVSMGHLGELKGRDALSLRELILAGNDVQDQEQAAGLLVGGKGRDMRNNEAEEGPLTEADSRKRHDKTGLYKQAADRQTGVVSNIPMGLNMGSGKYAHPAERRWIKQQKELLKRRRRREAEELYGQQGMDSNSHLGSEDKHALPRFQQITCNLYMPFDLSAEDADIPPDVSHEPVFQLKLHGTHVLAGLKTLVERGLNCETGEGIGLPAWLVDIRGTKISVGKDLEQGEGAEGASRVGARRDLAYSEDVSSPL